MAGPLHNLRIIELAGLGPCPFAGMMLADMGAEVIRIDRKPSTEAENPYPTIGTKFDVMARGRQSVALDLKQPASVALVLHLIEQADALIEGFRPGVMERLGLGPEACMERNPRLVYGRVTGWGQEGPLAKVAGHDINYLALSGLLPDFGRPDSPPPPPLNLVGDFGGGGMMFAFGVLSALWEARSSGLGQVVDAAMLDGSLLLGAMIYGQKAHGLWSATRGENMLSGASHFYDTYECADGKFVAIGAIEPNFYALLLQLCSVNDPEFDLQQDPSRWPSLKDKLAAVFKSKTRQEWCERLEGKDACFAPVLDMDEAPDHAHNKARNAFVDIAGVIQPAPAPRFSRSVPPLPTPPPKADQQRADIFESWRVPEELRAELELAGN